MLIDDRFVAAEHQHRREYLKRLYPSVTRASREKRAGRAGRRWRLPRLRRAWSV